jgi:hypothetical protein
LVRVTGTEKFIKVDNEGYVKQAVMINGGILKAGFLSYMIQFKIIGKGPDASGIRSTIEYEFDDGRPELEDLISTEALDQAAELFAKYAKEHRHKTPPANS